MNTTPSTDASIAPLRQHIVSICSEVLQLPDITADDNFAAVGGDSLSGVRVLYILKECFGVDISLARLLEAESLAALAQDIENAPADGSDTTHHHDRGVQFEEGFV